MGLEKFWTVWIVSDDRIVNPMRQSPERSMQIIGLRPPLDPHITRIVQPGADAQFSSVGKQFLPTRCEFPAVFEALCHSLFCPQTYLLHWVCTTS
jgi:hypothetical protein